MKDDLESIFSYAVALEQSGRQKNTIFGFEDVIYILNADKTVLLKFKLTSKELKQMIAFTANDYDSQDFYFEDGAIVFVQKGTEFERKKRCKAPDQTFKDAEVLYQKFAAHDSFQASIAFYKDSIALLNENLSHVEFFSKEKKLYILQRDIFAGSVIELTRKETSGLGVELSEDEIKEDFGPIGMRTNDLFALFAFNKRVKINFLPPAKGYFVIEGDHYGMTGIVAGCLYDDIGELYKIG